MTASTAGHLYIEMGRAIDGELHYAEALMALSGAGAAAGARPHIVT
jgi:hypothetical protein